MLGAGWNAVPEGRTRFSVVFMIWFKRDEDEGQYPIRIVVQRSDSEEPVVELRGTLGLRTKSDGDGSEIESLFSGNMDVDVKLSPGLHIVSLSLGGKTVGDPYLFTVRSAES